MFPDSLVGPLDVMPHPPARTRGCYLATYATGPFEVSVTPPKPQGLESGNVCVVQMRGSAELGRPRGKSVKPLDIRKPKEMSFGRNGLAHEPRRQIHRYIDVWIMYGGARGAQSTCRAGVRGLKGPTHMKMGLIPRVW